MIRYSGHIKDGRLHVTNRKRFDADIALSPWKDVTITIDKKKKPRGTQQNRYYWGYVIPIVQQGLRDAWGETLSKEQSHELLKQHFLYKEIVNVVTGEITKITKSSSGLTTVEFMDYIAEIQGWAAQYLGINIPDPGEQVEMEIE